jgi:hypothetical protein
MLILLFNSFFGFLGIRIGRSARVVRRVLDQHDELGEAPVIVYDGKVPHAKGVCMGLDRRRILKRWGARVFPEPTVQPST